MATIVVKNNTAGIKNWGGRQYLASTQYTIEEIDKLRLLTDSLFISDVNSGNAIITDGTTDLSASVGLARLGGVAVEHWFNNSSNGFASWNVQSAIEEAKSGAAGKLLSFTTLRQGGAGNSYLYFGSSGITTDYSPLIVPGNARIIGITAVSNSGSRNYDINLNISKVNLGSVIDRTLAYQVRNSRDFIKMDWTGTNPNYNLSAGDKIGVYCQSQGGSPSDLVVMIYMQLTSGANVSISENYSTPFSIVIGPITIIIG